MVSKIEVRGARVHNLKNVDVDIPLNKIVGVAGVSGSGKSSLALGVLYTEGSRRYLEALSTYTRRRLTQAPRADVDEVLHVPAALALHQRPGVPGIRSTFGTGTELLNTIRLMFSRLASHPCPNGHMHEPTLDVAAERQLVCPVCGERFFAPGAEDLAFNSGGACRTCDGTGVVRSVDRSTLVPDESLTIDEGAVMPWRTLMWSLMTDVCRAMGVRTNVPFRDLTPEEKHIVYDGPMVKKHIFYHPKGSNDAAELDFTYYSAVKTVENALSKVKDEAGMKRVERFLRFDVCPDCGGSRFSQAARAPRIMGVGIDDVSRMPLVDLCAWVDRIPDSLPEAMRPMAQSLCEAFRHTAARLLDLGLGYLSLDRAASTLSTGERQRMQLARAVRNRTTGVLYVLDEPSIGLHPANVEGLKAVMHDLVADGNTVLLVDHDVDILREADRIIEMGPKAGREGGRLMAQGTVAEIEANPDSMIGPYLAGRPAVTRTKVPRADLFKLGEIRLETKAIHTVKPLRVRIPKGRLTVVTGVSGSGKTTLVLESLLPALKALAAGAPKPEHVARIEASGIREAKLIDATPIGVNVRSTVATYANVHDDLRKAFAKTPDAKAAGLKAGDFSYNTGKLRCPECDGTGTISLDVQFLPDVDVPCPVCRGSRYAPLAFTIKRAQKSAQKPASKSKSQSEGGGAAHSLPEFMDMDVSTALRAAGDMKTVAARLGVLEDLGLGYLTLGEATPGLSGGEAQRLKLAGEMSRGQSDALFIFDEPTIGLHPENVATLMAVFGKLVEAGATVIVIEHDLDVIRAADWMIDLGPGGGEAGGEVVFEGVPEEAHKEPRSVTGHYLAKGLSASSERRA